MKWICSIRNTFSCILVVGITYTGSAQQVITGSVSDAGGTLISGATVRIQETNQISITDNEGRFSITGDSTSTIEISHVGYTSARVNPKGKELHIQLNDAETILDELIVVGYGIARRKDVTGAVAKISEADFTPGLITNPLQKFQGKVAGVVITQPGGDPNGDFSVRIRGATSLEGQPPLLVVDVTAIDDFNRYMNTVNPSDIESIDILKDVTAGARCVKWELNDIGVMDNDFAVFRLADIILIKAEAQLRNGDTEGALQKINQKINSVSIRSRAGLEDFTLAELTLESVMKERACELAWEGHRRNDLIRFGHFTDARVPEPQIGRFQSRVSDSES